RIASRLDRKINSHDETDRAHRARPAHSRGNWCPYDWPKSGREIDQRWIAFPPSKSLRADSCRTIAGGFRCGRVAVNSSSVPRGSARVSRVGFGSRRNSLPRKVRETGTVSPAPETRALRGFRQTPPLFAAPQSVALPTIVVDRLYRLPRPTTEATPSHPAVTTLSFREIVHRRK